MMASTVEDLGEGDMRRVMFSKEGNSLSRVILVTFNVSL